MRNPTKAKIFTLSSKKEWNEILSFGICMILLHYVDSFIFQQAKQTPNRLSLRQTSKRSSDSAVSRFNGTSTPDFVTPRDDFSTGDMEFPVRGRQKPRVAATVDVDVDVDESFDRETSNFADLLKLASMHCASQALNTAVKLKIPDLMGSQTLSVEELAQRIEASNTSKRNKDTKQNRFCHRDALFRTLRLLATIDIVREEPTQDLEASQLSSMSSQPFFQFSLTTLGMNLRTTDKPNIASCILHWMEEPLWDSWLELSDYIQEGGVEDTGSIMLPFERANNGISSDYWYNKEEHPESLKNANDFVHLIHDHELQAVVNGLNWSYYKNHRLVDVAGNNGRLAEAIAASEPSLQCYCLDLPSVIERVSSGKVQKNVKLVPGNVFNPETIPDCEVILMKHFCDRCMWSDDQTIQILQSCKTVLQRSGDNGSPSEGKMRRKIVIADAVVPDCGRVNETNKLQLHLDALYMLVGRERQRTRSEWKNLAQAAGLTLSGVIDTAVPSCSLIVLEPKSDLTP